MVDYLNNKICKFIPLFPLNINKKKNIVSISLFKISGGGYKNFDKYINGLKKISKYINVNLPDFTIRLFIDESIHSDANIMRQLLKIKILEMVLYTCPAFVKANIHHIGTFGTLVRFFPMFNFRNNDANIVISQDADFNSKLLSVVEDYKMLKIYKTREELNKLYIFWHGRLNNPNLKNTLIYKNKYISPYIVADRLMSFKRIPPNIIINYIKFIPNSKHILSDYLITKKERKTKCQDYICFGVDEYFLNHDLKEYLINTKKAFGFYYSINLHSPLFFIREWIYDGRIKKKNLMKKYQQYYKFLLQDVKHPKKRKKDFLFDIFYGNNYYTIKQNFTKNNNTIALNYYKLFKQLYKHKDFSIYPKDYIDIALSKNMLGKYHVAKYKFYFMRTDDIILTERLIKDFDKEISNIPNIKIHS